MANAQLSTSLQAPIALHARPLRLPFGPFPLAAAPTTLPLQVKTLGAKREAPAIAPDAYRRGLDTQKRQKAAWATADLRQYWADAGWLRAHLTVARLRVGVSNEPATAARLKAKLRGIGVQSPEVQEAVGMTLANFLRANPRLPLWVALAMVLEATGRFTPVEGSAV